MKQNNIHCYSVYSNDVIYNFDIELKEKKKLVKQIHSHWHVNYPAVQITITPHNVS